MGKIIENLSNYTKEKIYGGVDVKGNILIPISFEAIYSETENGITTYYILNNGKEYNATDLINAMKLRLGYTQDEIEPEEEKGMEQQGSTETVDSNTVENNVVVNTGTTNTVETSVEPTEENGIMRATNMTSNSINANQNNLTQNSVNTTTSNSTIITE